MSDNVNVTEGSGKIVAAEDVGGKLLQRIKLALGSAGIDAGDVSSTNPLPITGSITVNAGTNLNTSGLALESTLSALNSKVIACNTGATVISSGTVTANLGTIGGIATETTLASLNSKITACNTGAVVLAAGVAIIGSLLNISGTISLPTGAATAANQTTQNSSLSSLLSELQQKTEPADLQSTTAIEDGTNAVVKVGDASNKAIRVNVVAGGSSGGGVSQADKSAFVEGSGSMTPVGGVFNDTIGSDVTEDKAAALRITAKRGLHVNLRDSSGVELTSFPVTGTITANLGTIAGVATETTLSALNAKVTACNTGAVVVSSGTITANLGTIAGVATETTLSSLNSKVTACNTGAVTITALPAASLAAGNLVHIDYDSGAGTQNIPMVGFALPASGGSVAGGTSTNPLRMDPTGTTTQPVSVASLPLPSGAATEATLSTLNGKVTACNTGAVVISSGTVTANLGTIAGVATETTLSALNTKVTACNTGAVVISSGTITTVSTVTNLAQLGGAAISMNTGVRDAGTQRVTIATNDVVPSSQSGTWNINNVSGTVSLPTGAATETTLSALNTKVTACNTGAVVISSGTVTANIGTTGGLALDATLAKLTITQGTALGSNTQALVGASVTTAAPTYTTGQISPLSMTTGGLLRVDGSGVTQPISGTVTANIGTIAGIATETTLAALNTKVTACNTGAVVISSGTITTVSTVTNLSQLGGAAISMNTGVRDAGTQRVTIATNDVVPSSQSGTWNITNVSGTVSLPTGAATSANQTTELSSLSSILTELQQKTEPTDLQSTTAVEDVTNTVVKVGDASNKAIRVNVVAGGASGGGVSQSDKSTFTEGTTSMNPVGGVFNNTIGSDPTEDQAAALRITAKRGLHVNLRDNSGVEITSFPVTGTVTANLGTIAGVATETTLSALNTKVTACNTGAVVISSGTITTVSTVTNLSQLGGSAISMNTGVRDAGTQRVTIATNDVVPSSQSGTWNITNVSGTVSLPTGAATETTLSSLNGKVTACNTGAVVISSGTVTANAGTGTFTTAESQLIADNAGFTDGTSKVFPAGYIFDEVAGTALTENDSGAARMDSKRAQVYVLEDATTRGQRAAVTAGNALKVDGSAVTQPVSGTVTANLGTIAGVATETTLSSLNGKVTACNTGAVVISSGTVTANIGTTNGLALDATLAKLTIAQGASLGANTQALSGGSVTTAAPTYTTGQISPLSLTTAGLLRVDVSSATLAVTQSGTWNINNVSGTVSLPTGAATETTLSSLNGKVTACNTGAVVISSGTVTANLGTIAGVSTEASLAKLTVVQGTALGSNTQAMVGGSVTTAAPTYTTGQISPISLTTAGLLRVDGSGVTQPISASSLPLPTGAATETTLSALNTKVTACNTGAVVISSGTVTANIGTTNGLALDATLAKLTVAQGTALGSNTQALAGGSVTTAAPTYTTGQISPLSLTTAGLLRVDVSSASLAVTQSGTWNINNVSGTVSLPTGASTEATLSTLNGKVTACNTGAVVISSGTVTANAGTGTFTTAESQLLADNAAFTDGTSKLYPNGYIFDEVAGTSLTENDIAAARVDSKRAQVWVLEDETTRGRRATVTAGKALVVDGSAVTQPVSAASLPLPTGAATETTLSSLNGKVTACNTGAVVISSGTVTANLGTIAGVSTESSLAKLTIAQGAALGANTQALAGGSVTTAAPTYTTGQISPLSLTTAGLLRVDVSSATLAVTQSGTWNINNVSGTVSLPTGAATEATLSTLNGKVTACNTGAVVISSGTVTANAGTGTFTTAESQILADNAGFTDGTTKLFASGYIFDEVAGTALTENDLAAARVDSKRAQVWVLEDATTRGQRAAVTASNALKVDGSAVTQPVSAASLPLPTGAATETTLAALNTKVTACNTGAVVISSGTITTVSTVTNLSQLGGTAISMNTGVRDAGTQRVTIATNDVVPVSQSGTWNITNVSGTVSLPTGAATQTTLASRLSEAEFDAVIGEVQTNPSVNTVLGRLKAIANDLEIGPVATSSGQTVQTTSLQLIDDMIHAANAAIGKIGLVGGQMDDTSSTDATENNVSAFRITAKRALHINLRDSSGVEITTLPVSLASVPSHAVTNAGTFVVQENGAALTSLQLIDDTVYSGDATLSKYLVMGGVLDDTSTVTVTENNAQSVRITGARGFHVNLRDNSGNQLTSEVWSSPSTTDADRGLQVVEIVKKSANTSVLASTTFNNTTTTATSSTITIGKRYRKFLFFYNLTKANAGTKDLTMQVQFSQDGGTTWFDYQEGAFGNLLENNGSIGGGIKKCVMGDCVGLDMRFNFTATGTTATETITAICDIVFSD